MVFLTPHSLQLVQWFTDEVMKMPEVNRDRVVNLATEDNITGNEEGMLVEAFFETPSATQTLAKKHTWQEMAQYQAI